MSSRLLVSVDDFILLGNDIKVDDGEKGLFDAIKEILWHIPLAPPPRDSARPLLR
jgi:hypothetical protein